MKLVDPMNITKFDRTDEELQNFWLYCIFVAGRNADMCADKLSKFLSRKPKDQTPFEYLKSHQTYLHNMLVAHRVGQYYRIEKAIQDSLELDLRTVTVEQLEQVFGVGPKTARLFILHTRKDAECAVLDIHILKWLKARQGGDKQMEAQIPDNTPQNKSLYDRLEKLFIYLAKIYYQGIPLAEIDLLIWSQMSGRLSEFSN